MYKFLIRPLLFTKNPEDAHYFTFGWIKRLFHVPGVQAIAHGLYNFRNIDLKTEAFGLTFDNPVGLAAGFDKDAKLYNELSAFGFGFIEIGTITPKGQSGNNKPRLLDYLKIKV